MGTTRGRCRTALEPTQGAVSRSGDTMRVKREGETERAGVCAHSPSWPACRTPRHRARPPSRTCVPTGGRGWVSTQRLEPLARQVCITRIVKGLTLKGLTSAGFQEGPQGLDGMLHRSRLRRERRSAVRSMTIITTSCCCCKITMPSASTAAHTDESIARALGQFSLSQQTRQQTFQQTAHGLQLH